MLPTKHEEEFTYYEAGSGPTVVLLHGLFGALSNFKELVSFLSTKLNVLIPILPIYSLPVKEARVSSLVAYLERFVAFKDLGEINLVGNSLGGHIALLYTFANSEKVKTLTLTGSSGLFENSLGSTFPRRGDYDFIQKKTEATFYDPTVATKELVDEVFDIVNNREKVLRVLSVAKSAIRHNVGEDLGGIQCPTLLVWGQDDSITPPFVAEAFQEKIADSELYFLEKCGHAAMMEKPEEFNDIIGRFLRKQLAL